MCASRWETVMRKKVGSFHGHAVEHPLTDTPKSSYLAYTATWHCPSWSTINTLLKTSWSAINTLLKTSWSAINTILKNTPKCGHLAIPWSRQFFGPSSTWTIQNSLDNVGARVPLTQDCPPSLIKSTTGHYNSTGRHSTSFWLAFPASVQQGRALEHTSEALKSMSTHCHAFRKYTRTLWSRDTSFFTQDAWDGTNGVHIRKVAL